jgi:branched-chain amino acid transport system substrate-binding protein
MLARYAAAFAVTALLAGQASAADPVRLGFITSLSGPFAAIGEDLSHGFDLAMEHLGGKLGGYPTVVEVGDTKSRADEAVSEASRLVDRHNVQIITGILNSSEFNAIGKGLNDRGVFVVSGNAGSSMFAGAGCLPNIFVASFQNDTLSEALARYMNEKGIKTLATVALNYQAGKDYTEGVKRLYKGKILAELYPEFTAVDFSSEIAQIRSANPEALHMFMPGRGGVGFIKQFVQSGLNRKIQMIGSSLHADEMSFAALGDVAMTMQLGQVWAAPLDNPANQKFVTDFNKKYGRLPTYIAAGQYDAVMLIDSAVRGVKGEVDNKDAFRAAMHKADFKSVKGYFKLNNNNYPIQDHYILGVEKGPDGKLRQKIVAKASSAQEDPYAKDCPMKW